MRILIVCILSALLLPSGLMAQTAAVPTSQAQISLSFAPVAKKASPAVVNIYTKRTEQVRLVSPFMNDPLFGQLFGDQLGMGNIPRERVVRSLGSGVIIDPHGTVVTSYHVIKGADQITIILASKAEYEAKVEKVDERSDLAILKIDGVNKDSFPFLELRDSDTLEVGDLVLAIGNPFGVGQTVTQGIVSALARAAEGVSDYQFFIQTDAAINPGNSGGALVDVNGQLVGVNTAIYSTSGGSNGIGFAIPANMVKAVLAGKASAGGAVVRPWLGLSATTVTAEMANSLGFDVPTGMIVQNVYEKSPAEKAGIKTGDVITTLGGKPISNEQELNFRIATSGIGNPVDMGIIRDGKQMTLTVTPVGQDADEAKIKTVTLGGKGPLRGLEVADITPQIADLLKLPAKQKGVIVVKSARGGFGMSFRTGDVILQINGMAVKSVSDLQKALSAEARGLEIVFQRGGMITTMSIR